MCVGMASSSRVSPRARDSHTLHWCQAEFHTPFQSHPHDFGAIFQYAIQSHVVTAFLLLATIFLPMVSPKGLGSHGLFGRIVILLWAWHATAGLVGASQVLAERGYDTARYPSVVRALTELRVVSTQPLRPCTVSRKPCLTHTRCVCARALRLHRSRMLAEPIRKRTLQLLCADEFVHLIDLCMWVHVGSKKGFSLYLYIHFAFLAQVTLDLLIHGVATIQCTS